MSETLPPGAVGIALCPGAGLRICPNCAHLRDNHPAGTRSRCPDYDPGLMVRDGRCRWWMAAPGRAGMTP